MPRSRKSEKRYPKTPVRRSVRSYPHRKVGNSGEYDLSNGPWANAGDWIGSTLGKAAFGRTAGNLGGWLGRRLFHYPAKLFGSGAYHKTKGREKLAPQTPIFESKGLENGVLICHKEYIGDIITSSTAGAFKVDTLNINPAEPGTFPWLSGVAAENFQQYRFEGLVFEFKSFSADALSSTNTALGSVFAAINYDYNDGVYTSRAQIENTDWSMSCKPSDNMLIPVECAPQYTALNGFLYVVNGATVPTGADPKTYYLGRLAIATKGGPAASINIGSLYVTYKVRLMKPISALPAGNSLMYHAVRASAGVSGSNNLGQSLTSLVADSFGCTLDATNSILTVSNARLQTGMILLLCLQYEGSSTASVTSPSITITNGTGLNYFTDESGTVLNSNYARWPQSASTSDRILLMDYISVTDGANNLVIQVGTATWPSSNKVTILLQQVCGIPTNQIGTYIPTQTL